MIGVELRVSARMLRGQAGRAWLFIFCVAVGVAARVGVGNFMASLQMALRRDARVLLGADLELSSKARLDPAKLADLERLAPAGHRVQRKVSLLTMASQPRKGLSRLVQLSAVEAAYPYYGALNAVDGAGRPLRDPIARLQTTRGVLVQAELLPQLGIGVGQSMRIGRADYQVLGVLKSDTGLGASAFSLGPSVIMGLPHLEIAGITGYGSRSSHETMVALPQPEQAAGLAAALRSAWKLPDGATFRGFGPPVQGVRVKTFEEAQGEIKTFFDRLANYLALVSLLALLLGGVGVASVTRAWVREAYPSLGVLRAVGADSGALTRIYFYQCLALGLLGSLLGMLGGVLAQGLVARSMSTFLPVKLDWAVDVGSLGWGLLLGLLCAVIFSLLPLAAIRQSKAAELFRDQEPSARWDRWSLGLGALGALIFAALAAYETSSWVRGPGVLGAALLGALILGWAGAWALPRIAAWRRPSFPFAIRHGLANLGRPGLRPASSVIALGSAALLLGILAVYQGSLLAELDPGKRGAEIPQLFFIDVQRDQVEDLKKILSAEGADSRVSLSPMVRARYRPQEASPARTKTGLSREQEDAAYMRNREQNLSWRPNLSKGESIVAGKWMDVESDALEASVEQRFAKQLGLGLGDTLRLDVQGVELEATITSLRKVEWGSMQPNFFILISPWAIQDAPQTWIGSVGGLADGRRGPLQTSLAGRFPNVTVFDVADGMAKIMGVMGKISDAVRLVAFFCLVTGLVVLIGIALSTARQRQVEGALLKTLGAGKATLLASIGVEFGILALFATSLGLTLSAVFGWVLITQILNLHFTLPWRELGTLLVLFVTLGAGTGVAASWRGIGVKPLEVLRED